jgi:hypothetical protein
MLWSPDAKAMTIKIQGKPVQQLFFDQAYSFGTLITVVHAEGTISIDDAADVRGRTYNDDGSLLYLGDESSTLYAINVG